MASLQILSAKGPEPRFQAPRIVPSYDQRGPFKDGSSDWIPGLLMPSVAARVSHFGLCSFVEKGSGKDLRAAIKADWWKNVEPCTQLVMCDDAIRSEDGALPAKCLSCICGITSRHSRVKDRMEYKPTYLPTLARIW